MTANIKEALELKPCPFCGRKPEIMPSGDGGKGLMIECITPGCVNPHTSYYDHASAVRAWNTRATPASLSCGEARERIALQIWHRFADNSTVEWEDETHKDEFLLCADAILATGCVPGEASIRADERKKQIERDAKVAEDKYGGHFAALGTQRAYNYEHAGEAIAAAIRDGRGEG